MSNFVDEAINPKTNKIQSAWLLDDYFGRHHYAVAFPKDGTDALFSNHKIIIDDYYIYSIYQIKLPKDK